MKTDDDDGNNSQKVRKIKYVEVLAPNRWEGGGEDETKDDGSHDSGEYER